MIDPHTIRRLPSRLRREAGAFFVDNLFRGLAAVGRLHPMARPGRHGVEIVRDLPYRDTGMIEHRLDLYRPTEIPPPWPVVLYVHGGGFRILSKETHWIMGLAFARRGYLVANISYRLAPKHRFPAAIEDASAAYLWTVREIARHGGDTSRLVLAGESAGANLVTSLALATCYERPEPFARAVYDSGVVPSAVVAACGILQVTDVDRFRRRRKLSPWVHDRLTEVSDAYLGRRARHLSDETLDLADPLLAFERGTPPSRPLPPFIAPVGTKDPLLDDSRRLKVALERLGVRCEVPCYPGEPHAFHAVVVRPSARKCWRDIFDFLAETGAPPPLAHRPL